MNKKISLFSLIVLIVASIDNIRNLPAAALFGSSLFFFFALAAIVFLIPTALVSAELSAAFPESGGVCHWVSQAFGKRWGMTAIWLQWINTIVWYPTMLSFIAATLAYLINPALVANKFYMISSILIIFWSLTLINLKGLRVTALLNNIFGIIGTILPLGLLCLLGLAWYFLGKPLSLDLKSAHFIPSLTSSGAWTSLVAIMASFLGMELSGVHVNDIHNPQRNFPKAIALASLFIFLSMLIGSLTIALILPQEEINLVAGITQVYASIFATFGLSKFMPLLTFLIVLGSMGNLINWLISPAKGLLQAADLGFLPPFFAKKNKAGIASNILITQALFVTLFSLSFFLIPSVNAIYWFFTALSTELYMFMYILMFSACLYLRYKHKNRSSFQIPGKNIGIWLATLLGTFGCLLTIIISFFPPDAIQIGNFYFAFIALGTTLCLAPLAFFFSYEKKTALQSDILT